MHKMFHWMSHRKFPEYISFGGWGISLIVQGNDSKVRWHSQFPMKGNFFGSLGTNTLRPAGPGGMRTRSHIYEWIVR